MGKQLIIVESPAKVRTIKKFLGSGYDVAASVGHVRDLPAKQLGVDETTFDPEYRIIPGKEKIVEKLRKSAAKADSVFLAPDPDREGEAIAWHVAELIRDTADDIRRIQFNEITSRAVKEALEHPRELDQSLFNSQQARRILDRLVGYKVSPLLWKKVKRGISAGRVQSVALKIIVDREKERLAFEPQEYWLLKAVLEGGQPPAFGTDLWKMDGKTAEVGDQATAEAVEAEAREKGFTVSEVAEKQRSRAPLPPFITSTLQQEASRRLGYSAKKTMSTAQRLYEGVDLGAAGTTALITYMRTDSVRISDDARDDAAAFIKDRFGEKFYPPKARKFKTKSSAQDAHEAIRPVDVNITPKDVADALPRDQHRLYTLVWQRFVASQMANATFKDTTITASAGTTLWRAKGERLLFLGWLKAYGDDAHKEAPQLPKVVEGETLELKELTKEQKFTQPPPRYSEASLVKELEEKGIGRPSTYAAIIATLLDREYCRMEDKRFAPTDLGVTVSDLLSEHFVNLMDVHFTARMEDSLDAVAEGKQDWVALLKDFTGDFYTTLDKARTVWPTSSGAWTRTSPARPAASPWSSSSARPAPSWPARAIPAAPTPRTSGAGTRARSSSRRRSPPRRSSWGATAGMQDRRPGAQARPHGLAVHRLQQLPGLHLHRALLHGRALPPGRLRRDPGGEELAAGQDILLLQQLPRLQVRHVEPPVKSRAPIAASPSWNARPPGPRVRTCPARRSPASTSVRWTIKHKDPGRVTENACAFSPPRPL